MINFGPNADNRTNSTSQVVAVGVVDQTTGSGALTTWLKSQDAFNQLQQGAMAIAKRYTTPADLDRMRTALVQRQGLEGPASTFEKLQNYWGFPSKRQAAAHKQIELLTLDLLKAEERNVHIASMLEATVADFCSSHFRLSPELVELRAALVSHQELMLERQAAWQQVEREATAVLAQLNQVVFVPTPSPTGKSFLGVMPVSMPMDYDTERLIRDQARMIYDQGNREGFASRLHQAAKVHELRDLIKDGRDLSIISQDGSLKIPAFRSGERLHQVINEIECSVLEYQTASNRQNEPETLTAPLDLPREFVGKISDFEQVVKNILMEIEQTRRDIKAEILAAIDPRGKVRVRQSDF